MLNIWSDLGVLGCCAGAQPQELGWDGEKMLPWLLAGAGAGWVCRRMLVVAQEISGSPEVFDASSEWVFFTSQSSFSD